jgi:hypothetical protein
MQFEHGHPILEEFVKELASHFDGQDWGANGPKLVTRFVRSYKLFIGATMNPYRTRKHYLPLVLLNNF